MEICNYFLHTREFYYPIYLFQKQPLSCLINVWKYKNMFLFFIIVEHRDMVSNWNPSWRMICHQMETFSALLALCVGNSQVTGEFPSQRPGTQVFDVFFDLCLNKWLSKQSWDWWFETPSCPLWHHCNGQGPIYPAYSISYLIGHIVIVAIAGTTSLVPYL